MARALRLVLLGFGQLCAVMGAVFVALLVVVEAPDEQSVLHRLVALFVAAAVPALVMIPLLGAWSQSFSRQIVLRWASAYLVVVSLPFLFLQDYWLLWWTLVSLGLAVVMPLRAAFLMPASREMQFSVTRLRSLGLFYTLASVFLGVAGGYALARLEGPGAPLPAGYAVAFFALGLAATLVPTVDLPGMRGATTAKVLSELWESKMFRWTLPVGALVRGGFVALIGWLLLTDLDSSIARLHALTLFLCNAALACLISMLHQHPRRILSFVPFALTVLALMFFLQAGSDDPIAWIPALGWVAGFLMAPLHSAMQSELYQEEQLPGEILRRAGDFLATAAWAGLFALVGNVLEWSVSTVLLVLGFFIVAAAGLAWWGRLRDVAEMFVEASIAPLYRVRVRGTGLTRMPPRGPLIVLANHASWLDPVFIAKMLPRKTIPLMTSVFFDSPKLRWVMKNLGEAIRVEATGFRRDVPELKEAVAALDRGEMLLIFPEGAMRRREEQFLKFFGQGIVKILRERPKTPVLTLWVEGSWGSYFSYFNGLPTKNKKMDFLRPIELAVATPKIIDPGLLEDQRACRQYLMKEVAETRGLLGLEVPSLEWRGEAPEGA